MNLAKEKFDNDYGYTLMWLLDFHDGLLSSPNQILDDKINVLADEVAAIKSKLQQENKKKIISLTGGKKIGGMKNE